MKNEVWKVLNSKTRSSVGVNSSGPLSIYYPVGKFVKPSLGKIFCFKKKGDAITYRKSFNPKNRSPKWSIHRAVAKNLTPFYTMASDESGIKRFWIKGEASGCYTPDGTYVCDELKCLE